MKLLTKAIASALPLLYSQDGKGAEATVHVKFFSPWGSWTWFATEATAIMRDDTERELKSLTVEELLDVHGPVEDVRFFGVVVGFETEWGYFSLRELQSVRGPMGLRIERDMHFTAQPAREALGLPEPEADLTDGLLGGEP